MIKDLGAKIVSVWEGLRPLTKKMLVGAMQAGNNATNNPSPKFSYDAHSDWELSSLLSALDERSKSSTSSDDDRMGELKELAETCVRLLESQSGSAEVFIQLAERAIRRHDYNKLDNLADRLAERYTPAEIAEIVRQSEMPQIRAIAYETLAMLPVNGLAALMDDPLYSEIAANALEQKAFEYDSEEARDLIDHLEHGGDSRNW